MQDNDCVTAMARAVAIAAHAGQVDKAGEPYFDHVTRVAGMVRRLRGREDAAYQAALLHDVIEDTALTLPDLLAMGFPHPVMVTVDLLTRRDGESHEAAVARASGTPDSWLVKVCDVADNADPERLGRLDPGLREHLEVKYARAARMLLMERRWVRNEGVLRLPVLTYYVRGDE